METNKGNRLGRTAERHLKAITSGRVTRSNVIGLRKAFNHCARLREGLSGNRSNVTPLECSKLESKLENCRPRVVGELHDSGVKTLQSRRYAKRWTPEQAEIIAALDHFRLIPFAWIDSLHCLPAYEAVAKDGRRFAFFHVPWQAAAYSGVEAGPEVIS